MEKTSSGTSVGVDDPYAFAGRCDHVTDDGRCRFAFDHAASDSEFARERRREDYACPIVETAPSTDPDGTVDELDTEGHGKEKRGGRERGKPKGEEWSMWHDCPHYRSRTRGKRCVRCGLEERRTSGSGRPLLEEHHLSYAESSVRESHEREAEPEPSHEITVSLCRWCHAKVHDSWARIDDEASPDPEAIAAREGRLTREHAESAFETAAARRDERE